MEEEKITNNNNNNEIIFVSATNNFGNEIKLEYLGFGHAAVSDSFVDYTESFEYQYSESVGLWSSATNWLSKITARKVHDKKQKIRRSIFTCTKFKDLLMCFVKKQKKQKLMLLLDWNFKHEVIQTLQFVTFFTIVVLQK